MKELVLLTKMPHMRLTEFELHEEENSTTRANSTYSRSSGCASLGEDVLSVC